MSEVEEALYQNNTTAGKLVAVIGVAERAIQKNKKIILIERGGDWMACIDGNPDVWECANTKEAAVGKLCIRVGMVYLSPAPHPTPASPAETA